MSQEELCKSQSTPPSCPSGQSMSGASDADDKDNPCYAPIETIEELLSYGVTREVINGTEVEAEQVPACTLARTPIPINSSKFSHVKIQVNGRRYRNGGCPKTLVCHDFKGGYLDDRFVHGTKNPVNYVFRHWLQTDIFCYFSHKFVTIPPIGWINAAHKHGVQCIGTVITECEDGERICAKLLEDRKTIETAVDKLCLIAQHYCFDGYLVNIENKLEKPREMIEFLRLLTTRMKAVDPNAVVLWYDSVTVNGELKWQDELNTLNKAFFDVCDGIYLNYGWNDDKLHRSVEEADDREYDIFVGVDVFGRGCYGGGGLNTCLAVEKVASHRLSLAIFAPGWTFECHPYEDFPAVDNELWSKCAKYFFFRTLHNAESIDEAGSIQEKTYKLPHYQVLVSTDFNLGYGNTKFHFGKRNPQGETESYVNGPWFDLHEQSYQPILNCFRLTEGASSGFYGQFDDSKGFLGGGCLRVTDVKPELVEHTSPIWIPLDVPVRDIVESQGVGKCAAVAVVAWNRQGLTDGIGNEVMDNPIKIFLEFMKPSISTRKVIRLSNINEQIGFDLPQDPIVIHFKDFIPSSYQERHSSVPDIPFVFKEVPYAEAELNGWTISCFLMDVNHCVDWNITAFRLGAIQPVSVGLLGLALLSY